MKRGLSCSGAQATGGADIILVQDPGYQRQNSDSSMSVRSQLQDSAYGSIYERAEVLQDPGNRSGTEHTELPQLPDPAGHRQGEAASLLGQSESQPRNGIGEKCQDGAAVGVTHRNCLRRYLAPAEWIRSHPVLTLAVLTLLLLLAVALAVSLAAVSGRMHRDSPVTAVTPVTSDTPLLLACPHGWVGYQGICYFFSRDRLSWDQAQTRCSELEASLAVLKDKEMEFLFRLSKNNDYWLGLHRQDQRLQWVDGSSFSSSVKLQGNADCVHLAENYLGRQLCSSEMQYICSRAQTHL